MKLYHHLILALLLCLTACTNDYDFTGNSDYVETTKGQTSTIIEFSGAIVPSRTATRASSSLVNRLETHFPESVTTPGTYKVGLFGAYTGAETWEEYIANSEGTHSTHALATAGFFFNQPMTIGATTDSRNPLSYTPLRFWPNATTDASKNEYLSFWAYYPYNATADPGTLGISIVPDDYTSESMGSITVTVPTDADEQVDFMMSDMVANCEKSTYNLEASATPKRVPLTFHHMLAQIRIYAYMVGRDKINYYKDGEGKTVIVKEGDASYIGQTVTDEYGNSHTLAIGDSIPDDATCLSGLSLTSTTQRWTRTGNTDVDGNKIANLKYAVSFNNIYTVCEFTPSYSSGTTFTPDLSAGSATGSAEVASGNYIPNPYWFQFDGSKRVALLNTDYMYNDFETIAASESNTNTYGYTLNENNQYYNNDTKHYNFSPSNIILAVPQTLTDDDVPYFTVTVTDASDSSLSARITINLQNVYLKWDSGYIYCYGILDELRPGDDKVKGPENITVVFDPDQKTDQW